MHYMILQWQPDTREWSILHYTHQLTDILVWAKKYPTPQYVHMIDFNFTDQLDSLTRIRLLKERILASVTKEAETAESADQTDL